MAQTTVTQDIEQAENLEQAVYMAIGAASVCWESMEGTGVFLEDRAREVAEALLTRIKADR